MVTHLQSCLAQRENADVVQQFTKIVHTTNVQIISACSASHLFDGALAQLEHADVVERLGVFGVDRDGDFERLVGEVQITDADGHVTHVVPDDEHK